MCEDMVGCRCVVTRVDADVLEHGRIQISKDMGGYRCVRTWVDGDV